MRSLLKNKKVRLVLLTFFLIISFQFMSGCLTFRMSTKEMNKYFEGKSMRPVAEDFSTGDRNIHCVHTGNPANPTVVFFHGAPGSWSAFIDFLADSTLLKEALLVSVDRPGYGHSGFGRSEPSLERQAELVRPILEKYSDTPNILVGHSLGGPVIARIAQDFPHLVDGLIMVAPSIDPKLEPDEDWFRMPLHTPFLNWILPTSFRVTNEEIYPLEDELNEMLPRWTYITAPVTVIQGTNDKLVPPGNADFAKERLVNAAWVNILLEEGMNHFVPWNRPELITNAIMMHLRTGLEMNANNAR
ncbi:alpha/beta hydrolase [Fulvivirga sp. M361]|uniref:alpha/beta fold hydrolase n=1 Tax=Fulvivirga sp. M361 TaxID=2594266 RepID=UPI001179A91E|nr:alpha/beta hydrolase [Fulvivirga sp. M361]TRX55933.1 alpha/beta hydrolase [Fulvivirga sp. M361]